MSETVPYIIHFGASMRADRGNCGVLATMVSILPRLVTCQQCIARMNAHDRKEVPALRKETA